MSFHFFDQRSAERFAELLDETTGSRRHHSRGPADERLDELGTDYIDLLYYHGLGKNHVDWPKSKEMKAEIEAIKPLV